MYRPGQCCPSIHILQDTMLLATHGNLFSLKYTHMTRVSKSFLVTETDHMYTGASDFTTENYQYTYLYHKQ